MMNVGQFGMEIGLFTELQCIVICPPLFECSRLLTTSVFFFFLGWRL